MVRFAHMSIFAYMQIFAHVCKSAHVKAPLDLKTGKLEKMTHENSEFCNFEDERRISGDPVACYRWFIFILA